MDDIQLLIQEVLAKGYLMSLATNDDGGIWVSDVIYIHDDNLNIYWVSDPGVRHSKAIGINRLVAATITVNLPGQDNFGIQVAGKAQKIDGPHLNLAKKHLAKRRKSEPLSDNYVERGDSWYMLRPTKIDLICERLYGFDKKTYEVQ